MVNDFPLSSIVMVWYWKKWEADDLFKWLLCKTFIYILSELGFSYQNYYIDQLLAIEW